MKNSKKAVGITLLIILLALGLFFGRTAIFGDTHIVILATSDMHGNVVGYSYEDDKETDNNGMARLYTYISQVRRENPTVFLIDAGDDIQGSIMTDDIANKSPENEHPVISAMNYMGYDSMTLGNHEFNWGITTMKKILSQAGFPVLAANVLDKNGDYVTGNGYTIVKKHGVKLAVIGVTTPQVPMWDSTKEGVMDTTFEPANVAVKRVIDEIGDQADIIMVSAHMGQYAQYDEDNESDSAQRIVEDNPQVDILQVAHMHITVNDKIGNIPVVGVRNLAREIARIDVTLDRNKGIKDISTSIVDMEDYEPSQEICELPVVKELHEKALNMVRSDGSSDSPSGESLGISTARFQPENEILGIPEGVLQDTAVIDFILNIELKESGADVASAALFQDSSDFPEGELFYKNVFNIYKHDNTLYIVEMTGKELKNYMEWSAGFYNTWKSGDINISFDPEIPMYLYDMFAGIDYEVNISKPVGQRIENVMFKGAPLKDDQVLKVAVNNYRYSSALKALELCANKRSWESSESVRDMIVKYIKENSPISPEVDHNWKITGIDLAENDPRRTEIINLINEGYLETPLNESYNLSDYEELIKEAQSNKAQGINFIQTP